MSVNAVKQKGFTMMEVMVALAIAAVVVAMAIPGFQTITLKSRETSSINTFAAMIGRARSEAVARNRQVVVCASANPTDATPLCSGVNEWESGWIMFVDASLDGQYQGGETLLQVGEVLPAGVTVRGSGFTDTITLSAGTGLLPAAQIGGLKYCDSRGFGAIRVLDVSLVGQVRMATDSNSDGTVEDAAGTEVTACTP